MALDQFHHSVRVVEINEGTRTVAGMVCTSEDADSTYFPLDKPVLIANLLAIIAKVGIQDNLMNTANHL